MRQIAFICIFSLIGLLLLSGLFLVFIKSPSSHSRHLDAQIHSTSNAMERHLTSSDRKLNRLRVSKNVLDAAIQKEPYSAILWLRLSRVHNELDRLGHTDLNNSALISRKIAQRLNPDITISQPAELPSLPALNSERDIE